MYYLVNSFSIYIVLFIYHTSIIVKIYLIHIYFLWLEQLGGSRGTNILVSILVPLAGERAVLEFGQVSNKINK